jgi:hypothetical protein
LDAIGIEDAKDIWNRLDKTINLEKKRKIKVGFEV